MNIQMRGEKLYVQQCKQTIPEFNKSVNAKNASACSNPKRKTPSCNKPNHASSVFNRLSNVKPKSNTNVDNEDAIQQQYERDFQLMKKSSHILRRRALIVYFRKWIMSSRQRKSDIQIQIKTFHLNKDVKTKVLVFHRWKLSIHLQLDKLAFIVLMKKYLLIWTNASKSLFHRYYLSRNAILLRFYFTNWLDKNGKRSTSIIHSFSQSLTIQNTRLQKRCIEYWFVALNRYRRNFMWEQMFDRLMYDMIPHIAPDFDYAKMEDFKRSRAKNIM
ncbi:hypothetical protein GJ496_000894 [Pomphorhynchus laevis]|nr:hypothetical protein GJ496_000894 [Pomphorhynchus laevis]